MLAAACPLPALPAAAKGARARRLKSSARAWCTLSARGRPPAPCPARRRRCRPLSARSASACSPHPPVQARCCLHRHTCAVCMHTCARVHVHVCVCTYLRMCVRVCEYTHTRTHTHPPRDESAASHLARRGARRCTRRIVFATLLRHAGASSYQRDQVLMGNHREQLQREKSRPKPHPATRRCVLIRGVA